MDTATEARKADDPRRRRLLEAAMTVFMRHGFRKASMDEVARAADVSRQGLYLHFETKEALFRETVRAFLDTGLALASARLADEPRLEAKLVGAFDEWIGRYVGMVSAGASDLVEASKALVGPLVAEKETAFVDAVARTLRASGILRAYKGLTARQLADTLHAAARGLKHGCASRGEFVEQFTVAARIVCAPMEKA